VNETQTEIRLPELLAPAGSWECARAAVANGANAIYFGLERHNARIRADNFESAELPDLMGWLHSEGVRGYLAMNTLVFEDELEEIADWVRMAARAGVDALIVQDVGLCRLIREISPDLPIHGSTQMTLTSVAGVEAARELGCSVAVLSRECTVKEIEAIRAGSDMPLEVFVHGALCVAYSGQCLTSEALGGRSANRGECAQACRMPYGLESDEEPVDLGVRKYLLSPQDLMGLPVLPALVKAGVSSLKIEGRLKSPEYVAAIVRTYRDALERLRTPPEAWEVPASDRYRMEMTFSRGFHTGWLEGIDNRALVHAVHPKKRGQLVGTVAGTDEGGVLVDLTNPVKPGDGVVFDAGSPESREEGGRIWEVGTDGPLARLSFERGKLRLQRILPGQRVWKTSDPALSRELLQSIEMRSPFRQPLAVRVSGALGTPLELVLEDEAGLRGQASSDVLLETGRTRGFTPELLQEQLDRMGDTPFRLGSLASSLPEGLFLPLSELNRVRRLATEALVEARRRAVRWTVRERAPAPCGTSPAPELRASPRLSLLVRNLAQLEVAAGLPVDRVYCELEDPRRFAEGSRLFAASGKAELFLVPPRIHKEGEDWILRQCLDAEADGWLVRNHDQARFFGSSRKVGDFCLNAANSRSAAWLLERMGLETIAASADLNVSQMLAMLRAGRPERYEIVLHQHMPMFHMEHCVFCAFLTAGKDFRDCGRPCESKEVRLVDHLGARHMLKSDAGCRNTVFNAKAQTGAEFAGTLMAAGATHFRLEALDEPPNRLDALVDRYRALLEGRLEGERLWKELNLVNQLGVTRGTLAS
jgi:putative protease